MFSLLYLTYVFMGAPLLYMCLLKTSAFISRVGPEPRSTSKVLLYLAKNTIKDTFVCGECGVEHVNWVGRCTSCKQWNTVKPFRLPKTLSSPLDPRAAPTMNKQNNWLPSSSFGTGHGVPLIFLTLICC